MAVDKIMNYTQKDGTDVIKVMLTPTKKFPDGYFYTSIPKREAVKALGMTVNQVKNDIYDLINSHTWCLSQNFNTDILVKSSDLYFHRELYKILHGSNLPNNLVINHVNGVGFDNTDENLNVVTHSQSGLTKYSKGYTEKVGTFVSTVTILGNTQCGNCCSNETDACILQYNHELKYISDNYPKGYTYNILDCFKGYEDILDQIRTGQITDDEAKLKLLNIERPHPYLSEPNTIKENAWYIYRYNLFQFFTDHQISIPKYKLNDKGYMIHSKTKEYLCPFY